MRHAPFVHLRVRSCYSLLESTVRLEELLQRCRADAMPAVGITDRANLFDALAIGQDAAKAGVQALVGCLLPLPADDPASANGRPAAATWLPVLVQNQAGYQNLLRLLSQAYLSSAGGAPEVRIDQLAGASDGLIALTGGPDGPIGRALLHGNRGLAEALLSQLEALFEGRLYVELMRHGLAAEEETEHALIELALARDLPLVATNDVHFVDAADYEAHDVLLCIADGAQVGQEQRRRLTPEHRLKSAAEMALLFADLPEAISNTLVIAQRCSFMVPTRAPILPNFPTTTGRDEASELRLEAEAGLAVRLAAYRRARNRTRSFGKALSRAIAVRVERHHRHEVRRLLPDRRRLHPLGEGTGHPGRPGPWLGRGLGGRLVARDHRPRPAALRPLVRAFSQP